MRHILLAAVAAALASPAAAEQGDLIVRLRAIGVIPNEKVGPVLPTFPTGSASVNNSVMPEIDFTYMWTKNIGTELILATTRHSLTGTGALAGVGRLASTWVLPPTVTVQYHFNPDGAVRPYLGAGANLTLFYATNASDALNRAIGATDVSMKSSFGFAGQAGVDIDLTKTVFLNLDVKYIDIGTRATLRTGALVNTVKADLNPLVVGVGLGMRF